MVLCVTFIRSCPDIDIGSLQRVKRPRTVQPSTTAGMSVLEISHMHFTSSPSRRSSLCRARAACVAAHRRGDTLALSLSLSLSLCLCGSLPLALTERSARAGCGAAVTRGRYSPPRLKKRRRPKAEQRRRKTLPYFWSFLSLLSIGIPYCFDGGNRWSGIKGAFSQGSTGILYCFLSLALPGTLWRPEFQCIAVSACTPEIQYNLAAGRWTAHMVGREALKW